MKANGRPPWVFVTVGQRFGRLTVIEPETRTAAKPGKQRGLRAALCRCDCGNEKTAEIAALTRGGTRSCGCLKAERDRTIGAAALAAAVRSPEHRARSAERMRAKLQDPEARAFLGQWIQIPENRARARAARAAVGWKTPVQGWPSTHGLTQHPLYKTWVHMRARCHNPNDGSWKYYGARGIQVCPEWHDVRNFITWIETNLGPKPSGKSIDRIDNNGNYEPGNVRWATHSEQMRNQRPRRRSRAQDTLF